MDLRDLVTSFVDLVSHPIVPSHLNLVGRSGMHSIPLHTPGSPSVYTPSPVPPHLSVLTSHHLQDGSAPSAQHSLKTGAWAPHPAAPKSPSFPRDTSAHTDPSPWFQGCPVYKALSLPFLWDYSTAQEPGVVFYSSI